MDSGHLSNDQFDTHLSGREIRAKYQPRPGDRRENESTDSFWSRKSHEAKTEFEFPHDASLQENIVRHGVIEPITLHKEKAHVWEGHHRIAASYDTDPDRPIPVRWRSG